MTELFHLTLKGSLAFLIVLGLEALLTSGMRAQARRYWWIAVALAFLLPIRLPALPVGSSETDSPVGEEVAPIRVLTAPPMVLPIINQAVIPLGIIWGTGAAVSLLLVLWQTVATSRRWAGARFSTNPALLDLLEDCKREAGITAPIGLVLTENTGTPAILGWLRPRILLPAVKVKELDSAQLRHVFLHELAHFRAMDVPISWLFALMRCLHWFNPFAYWAERRWTRFREEAADEQALRWVERQSYGETLVTLLPMAGTTAIPGALALSETFPNLKHRIQLIMNNHIRKPRPVIALLGLAVLGLVIAIQPSRADEKADAVAATESWLQGIDAGGYAQSWKDASTAFQKAITEEQWVQALTGVRAPLGKVLERKLASSLQQKEVPRPGGQPLKGDFVISQFESSFENLKYAIETVTFEKDGETWKASGYYIKPKQ